MKGDSDVGDIVMLVTLCLRLFSLCWWLSQCIKLVINISNLSPIHFMLQIRHQHWCDLRNPENKKISRSPPWRYTLKFKPMSSWSSFSSSLILFYFSFFFNSFVFRLFFEFFFKFSFLIFFWFSIITICLIVKWICPCLLLFKQT